MNANADRSAFPNDHRARPDEEYCDPGLTKREYLSALFLQGLIASNTDLGFNEKVIESVNYADQLIYELSKPKEESK